MNSTETISQLIREHYDELSKGCKKVASYILDNFSSAALLSSTELAEKVNVSDTTVVRFSKALGFSGYTEFKKELRSVYVGTLYDDLHDMNLNQNNQYVSNYLHSIEEDLQDFIKTVDYKLIETIAKRLLSSRQVYIGGLGSDAVVAKFLCSYMIKMGFTPTLLVEEGHTLREYLLNISEQDTLLMCSFPKMFKDEYRMAQLAKQSGATLITLTDSERTSLLLKSDYNISVGQREKTFFNSYVIPMVFCNLLLLKIYELAPEKVDVSLKHYIEFINNSDMST